MVTEYYRYTRTYTHIKRIFSFVYFELKTISIGKGYLNE